MLTQPILDKLSQLHLSGFRAALEEQLRNPQYAELSFEERLGLLVDVETTRRANNSLQRRIQAARFPICCHHRRPRPLRPTWPQSSSDSATVSSRVGQPPS